MNVAGMDKEVLKRIEERKRFLLTSHARPDGDAIGSMLALFQVMRALDKDVEMVLRDPVPQIYRPLPYSEMIRQANQCDPGYDAAIILECDGVQRTGLQQLEACGRLLINIDHHLSARPFAHINWIDPSACATAEMIYQLARAAGVTITPDLATCLYTAVLTDTGSFCYEGTDEHTFALAQQLVRHGADPARIAQKVYFASPESKMRLLGAALSNLRRIGDLTWMFVTQAQMQQSGAKEEDCEGLVNYALAICGVEAALFFRELPNGRYRVSLRSKGAVNVADIAAKFGGGGHACASGFSVEGPLSRATEVVLAEFPQQLLPQHV